jgi:uncharacterized protein (DUF433 family)
MSKVGPSVAPVITAETPPLRVDEHGVIRVGGTRVTLDTLIGAFLEGESPEAIADQYSSVELRDVYATITYYLAHRDEVNAYLRRRADLATQTEREIERRSTLPGLRARLLARRQDGQS